MSTLKLNQDVTVETADIVSAKLEKKDSPLSAGAVRATSEGVEDLQVPDDTLIVKMRDGSGIAIRGGAETKAAWDLLQDAKRNENLTFSLD